MRDAETDPAKERRVRYGMAADTLDELVVKHSLVDSYENYKENGKAYPFIDTFALLPRAARYDMNETRTEGHNTALVFLTENHLDSSWMQYINFWDYFKATKKTIEPHSSLDPEFKKHFSQKKADVDHPEFEQTLKNLSELDYGLLVQPRENQPDRFSMTHFHVRIDYPQMLAAEEKARELGYLQGKLHEQEPQVRDKLMSSFFQYYGMHFRNAGGRRTAAAIAAHLLAKNEGHFSVYVTSEQSRVTTKITRQGLTKYALVPLQETDELAERYSNLEEDYLLEGDVGLLRVQYSRTEYGRPHPGPRKLGSNNMLQITQQELVPKPGMSGVEPIQYNIFKKKRRGDGENGQPMV